MMEVPNTVALDRSQPIAAAADVSKQQQQLADGGGGGVRAEAGGGNAGGGGQVVKRKRGRPPKSQPNPAAAKKSKEEDEDEDVCFICFDGGSLVLCDRRGCPKAYHPACIKRDEAFFKSKAKWNCGWHICSVCEKTAHHMCFTCTYSLCKGCSKKADFVCVRDDKGFCTVCLKTIMLIENSARGNETARVDFDDKSSWEYLFKVYWVYLKGKLSLTYEEITHANNPWMRPSTTTASVEPTGSHISATGRRSITSDMEANESKRRKTYEETNGLPKEGQPTDGSKEWASKELLDFVSHMKNGDTSVLSQFDVQALLLEYIKRNNLRDPRKNTQIICDLRLKNLFGKSRVGNIEMLKLLESHFSSKEDPQKNMINIVTAAKQSDADSSTDNTLVVGNKERRNHWKSEQRTTQIKLDEYAAIDVHNMNLIYLRRNLMESLIEDSEKFHEKVVGSIVQIRISGSDQKDDMYRLVQVVGTTKVDVPYKVGDKSVDVMLEVLNLDKKETVSIDTISNQELSEDECRRLRESIRCGLVRYFTVGEIQEKATALQSVLLDDRMETEMQRLNHLRDRASGRGKKKGYPLLTKLQLLKTPEERERRLQEIPEVHSDPKMNPDYESDDTEEYFNNEHGEHVKPKYPWVSGTNKVPPQKEAESLNDPPKDTDITAQPNVEEDSSKATEKSNTPNTGKEVLGSSSSERPQNEIDCNGSTIPKCNQEAAVSSSLPTIAPESAPSFLSMMMDNPPVNEDAWHYRDPSGNVQGPFSMVQLQKWSIGGFFPAEMRIWTSREADSLLLTDAIQTQFHNYDGRWHENVTPSNKIGNQIEAVNVCNAIPSTTTIPTTSFALDSVNLEKLPDARGSSGQSSRQDWNASDYNLNCNPPTTTSVAPLTKPNESMKPFDARDIPRDIPSSAPIVSSVFTITDAALVDLPSPLPKKAGHENEKAQDAGGKEPKLLVQDSGNPPSWSTALSLVVGGAQLPETADEWGRYPPAAVKPDEWDSGRVSGYTSKPLEVPTHQVAAVHSTMDQIMHSSPQPSSQPYNNLPSWHGLGETIEFSTLAEESVSDLLAEVDAMESRNGVPSPTSRRNSFLEDLFNGSIDDFSPTADQGTRSDGFSSTADLQLHRQSNTTTVEHLAGVSQSNNSNVFDMVKRSTGLHQFSFGLETKPTGAVTIPQTTNSENMAFKWAEMGGSDLQPSRLDMIDLNDSTRLKLTRESTITKLKKRRKTIPDSWATASGGLAVTLFDSRNPVEEGSGFPNKEEEEGEFVQPEAPPPPPPPPLLPPPPPPPIPPPPLTMGLDVVESRRSGSETSNPKSSGRPSGTTSTGRHTSRSGNVGRERESQHHRRSGGDRYSTSNSPRERSHHVEDSGGYSRSGRTPWSRQSSSSSSYSRPAAPPPAAGGGGSKGQRVCKFYESGRCKKGSACHYLHPQDR
ncbi:hypothetical protein OSB04_027335 [Centaurea solstitialis]|uniref:Zinc finger CCCH domain-containing protein 44 n=1 Tax=Centaurea solstitialis TaxID=347529 RepID=A0AA38W860_9ASTR|nr:hypothetical protein OSB04_027335 [Centaurea solstitialis]